jgi:ATP-binding protein involved in chromosome partitioning
MASKIDQVREALAKIKYPGMSRDIVSFGMLRDVQLEGGTLIVTLEMKSADAAIEEQVSGEVKNAIGKLGGFERLELRVVKAAAHEHGQRPAGVGADPFTGRKPIKGVKNIVAVASGKGGVGKSTVATNLAVGLAKKGQKVGLLDADIYGPSVHMMFGAQDLRPTSYDGKTLEPFVKHGVKFMSIGLLLGQDTPVIWRGPMVMKMLDQFMNDVNWGDLDVLVLDLPPGTGDAQLTIVQKVPLAGAVIVTTPQNVALMDAVRGLEMFKRVEVPVVGLVENMSFFTCPKCGTESHIFSHGGGVRTASELGIALLGEVPLETTVREAGDEGTPIVLAKPESASAKAFDKIVDGVLAYLAKTAPQGEAPKTAFKLNIYSSSN